MEKLPQEIIDNISAYLSREQLSNVLTLNKKFQHAAERHSGAFERFDLEENNTDVFLQRFSGHRFRYLRRVFFNTILPDQNYLYPEEKDMIVPCRETKEELRALDERYTQLINILFSTLKELESRLGGKYGPGRIEVQLGSPVIWLDRNRVCRHHAHVSWLIHLLEPEKLPTLAFVRSLHVHRGEDFVLYDDPEVSLRKLDLRILLDLANKLPNLESLSCAIGGNDLPSPLTDRVGYDITQEYQGPRRDSRHGFQKALAVPPPNLRELQLDLLRCNLVSEYCDQREAMPNLCAPLAYDPLSSSIRLLSYRLRRLSIHSLLDETLFWPTDGSTPYWPYLESINVRFYITSPSGSWYFNGVHGECCREGYELDASSYPPFPEEQDFCEEDDFVHEYHMASAQFRLVPNEDVLVPFLWAFCKATSFMPLLKEAVLWCPLYLNLDDMEESYSEYDGRLLYSSKISHPAWGLAYTKPDAEAFCTNPGEDFSSARQLWWHVGRWKPGPELYEAFRRIGEERYGKDVIEYWIQDHVRKFSWSDGGEFHFLEGLVDRDVFECYEDRVFPSFE